MKDPASDRVTIRSVAERAEVGIGTASRALNGLSGVRAETRRRVLEAAEALGYHLNPVAASFASGRRGGTAAHLMDLAMLWRGGCPSELRADLVEAAHDGGFDPHMIDTFDHSDPKRLARQLHHRGFGAALICTAWEDVGWFHRFAWDDFAVVSLSPGLNHPGISGVRVSHADLVRTALERLRLAGHRRVGCVLSVSDPVRPEEARRMGAAQFVLSRLPEEERVPVLEFCFKADPPAYARDWLREHDPDAILTINQAPFRWLEKAGMKTPERGGPFRAVLSGAAPGIVAGFPGEEERRFRAGFELLHQLVRTGRFGLLAEPVEQVIRQEWIEG